MSMFGKKKEEKMSLDVLPTTNYSELKFRIKEQIHYYKGEVKRTYYPELYLPSVPSELQVDYSGGCDYDDPQWVLLSNKSFSNIDDAKEICKDVKPYNNTWETKYHEI